MPGWCPESQILKWWETLAVSWFQRYFLWPFTYSTVYICFFAKGGGFIGVSKDTICHHSRSSFTGPFDSNFLRFKSSNQNRRMLHCCWCKKSCSNSSIYTYNINVYIYIYLQPYWPLFLKVNPAKQSLFQPKTRVIWVPGMLIANYIIVCYIYR